MPQDMTQTPQKVVMNLYAAGEHMRNGRLNCALGGEEKGPQSLLSPFLPSAPRLLLSFPPPRPFSCSSRRPSSHSQHPESCWLVRLALMYVYYFHRIRHLLQKHASIYRPMCLSVLVSPPLSLYPSLFCPSQRIHLWLFPYLLYRLTNGVLLNLHVAISLLCISEYVHQYKKIF